MTLFLVGIQHQSHKRCYCRTKPPLLALVHFCEHFYRISWKVLLLFSFSAHGSRVLIFLKFCRTEGSKHAVTVGELWCPRTGNGCLTEILQSFRLVFDQTAIMATVPPDSTTAHSHVGPHGPGRFCFPGCVLYIRCMVGRHNFFQAVSSISGVWWADIICICGIDHVNRSSTR